VTAQLYQLLVIGSNDILTVYEHTAVYVKPVNILGPTVKAA
jgi:hypothetical protein